jgi:hypothetical protein
MKKVSAILLVSLCLLLPYSVCAQSKQKVEKEFLTQLNTILKKSKQEHWKYKGTMTIDSAFAINKEGILSVTVHYTDDDSAVVRVRMEAPVKKILRVAYDLYLILEYKDDEVTVYESEVNSKELKKLHNTNLFHIGAPLSDGYKQKEKLQKVLEKMLE